MRAALPWITFSSSIVVGTLLSVWGFVLLQAHSELSQKVQTLSLAWDQSRPETTETVETAYPPVALTDGAVVLEGDSF